LKPTTCSSATLLSHLIWRVSAHLSTNFLAIYPQETTRVSLLRSDSNHIILHLFLTSTGIWHVHPRLNPNSD